ncbi:MAG: hypothetical protein GHHEDOFH_02891 [Pseudorhodoplanes sp.]|nr:hypothetical protein [Pseudorhodoplanes sp.]
MAALAPMPMAIVPTINIENSGARHSRRVADTRSARSDSQVIVELLCSDSRSAIPDATVSMSPAVTVSQAVCGRRRHANAARMTNVSCRSAPSLARKAGG